MTIIYNEDGFTLIELIMVMMIMGILMAIAIPGFHSWQLKAQIERHARELMADLNKARLDSIYSKRPHSLVINSSANGYSFKSYSSQNDSGGTVVFTKNIGYSMATASGSSIADVVFLFNVRGVTSVWNTIRINPTDSGAYYDCIVISAMRTNLGQMRGGSCVQR
ncbi:MAG: type II secretion system protein GspH [Geobacter sp.]|nr:MAG: type II secretion system protein GspH [Geobacter sp.]